MSIFKFSRDSTISPNFSVDSELQQNCIKFITDIKMQPKNGHKKQRYKPVGNSLSKRAKQVWENAEKCEIVKQICHRRVGEADIDTGDISAMETRVKNSGVYSKTAKQLVKTARDDQRTSPPAKDTREVVGTETEVAQGPSEPTTPPPAPSEPTTPPPAASEPTTPPPAPSEPTTPPPAASEHNKHTSSGDSIPTHPSDLWECNYTSAGVIPFTAKGFWLGKMKQGYADFGGKREHTDANAWELMLAVLV